MNSIKNTMFSLFRNSGNIQNLSTPKKYAYATAGGLIYALGLASISQIAFEIESELLRPSPLDEERHKKALALKERMGIQKNIKFVESYGLSANDGGYVNTYLPHPWGKAFICLPGRKSVSNDASIVRNLDLVQNDVAFKTYAVSLVTLRCIQVSKIASPIAFLCAGIAMRLTSEYHENRADVAMVKHTINAEEVTPTIRELEKQRLLGVESYKQGISGSTLNKIFTFLFYTPEGKSLFLLEKPLSKRIETIKYKYYKRNEPPFIKVDVFNNETSFQLDWKTSSAIFYMIKKSKNNETALIGANKITLNLVEAQDNIMISTLDGNKYYDTQPEKIQTFLASKETDIELANRILIDIVNDALNNPITKESDYGLCNWDISLNDTEDMKKWKEQAAMNYISYYFSPHDYDLSSVKRKRISESNVIFYIPKKWTIL